MFRVRTTEYHRIPQVQSSRTYLPTTNSLSTTSIKRKKPGKMPNHTPLLPLLLFAFLLSPCLAVQCYHPDGYSASDDYQPCRNLSSGASMCCATNRRDSNVNKCRPDGLCWEVGLNKIWRLSCTDPKWEDPGCLKLCADTGHGGKWSSYALGGEYILEA